MNILEILKSKPHNAHYLERYYKFVIACGVKNTNLISGFHKHHILPKAKHFFPEYASFAKYPWNCAKLTYEQHILAHWILAKAYGSTMWIAFDRMLESIDNTGNKVYSKETRLRYSFAMDKISSWRKENFKGKGNPFYGKTHSDKSKKLMTMSAKNRPPISDEAKQKMAKPGECNPFYGKTHSKQAREKMRKSKENAPFMDCPHCGKNGKIGGGFSRWHMDNCKFKGVK